MDHLAPPADVGRAGEPVVPEPHGVIEQPADLGDPHRARRPVGGRLQHHPAHLARFQLQAHPDVTVLDLGLREVGVVGLPDDVQGERHQVGAEHRAGVEQLGQVRLPSVVEPGRDVDREPHPTPDTAHHPNQPVRVGGRFACDRHEVDHLADRGVGEETGDQHRRVGRYICRVRYCSSAGRTRKWPPRSWSSRAPNTLVSRTGGSRTSPRSRRC